MQCHVVFLEPSCKQSTVQKKKKNCNYSVLFSFKSAHINEEEREL